MSTANPDMFIESTPTNNPELVALKAILAEFGGKRIITVNEVATAIYLRFRALGTRMSDAEMATTISGHAIALLGDPAVAAFLAPNHVPLEGGEWAKIAA